MSQTKIRNFCIIAHIDHGKSTLADRMLELTNTIEPRQMKKQLLDTMDIEQERGITIKLQPVQMLWHDYIFNLIDTPGHVDFTYEVSRSLAAVEGAILVVDATQGVQAQTLANVYLAIEAGLTIIPVINKIDLPAADLEKASIEIIKLLGCKKTDILQVSAKRGDGVKELLDLIITRIPAPNGKPDSALKALVFDSIYDDYRGVVLYIRVKDGKLTKADEIKLISEKQDGLAAEVGIFKPQQTPVPELACGQIGYIATNLKSVAQARVGDTVTLAQKAATEPLAGYKKIKPFVYAGFFTSSNNQYPLLKEALEKLSLNDAALIYTPETSQILGFGFRVGFLGLLHLEIIKERLEREYGLELIVTNPSTDYEVIEKNGNKIIIKAASALPDVSKIESIKEPWIEGKIVTPNEYIGGIIQLITSIRGEQKNLNYFDEYLALLDFEAPLTNVLTDFYDSLKSLTSGYGSFSYNLIGYRTEKLVKLDILIGGELIDSLSQIVHVQEAHSKGNQIVNKLKEIIPRQLFEISLQAAIGGKIIAREDIKALGKNVTAKLYGGDITRKRKLWEKQKVGKKKMKRIGQVDIPPEAFMALLKKD